LGTFSVGTKKTEKLDTIKLVKHAVKLGYRHFDTGAAYGNEAVLGQAFKEVFDEGLAKREDLFISSKISQADKQEGKIDKAINKTLSDL
jgi:alcohol dehydrogenase (NADP+)